MKITLAILFAFVAFACADSPIPECSHYDCPIYTVLSSNATASIEIREYASARWVRTDVQSFYYEEAVNIGFNRLFDYISGANENEQNIPMTAPVSVQILPGAGPFCESTFLISFYVPAAFQAPYAAPPAPTGDNVWIQTLPATTKAVYMFSGYCTQWSDYVDPISNLSEYCEEHNYKTMPNIETTAGYDSPFQLQNRHNEIWKDIFNM